MENIQRLKEITRLIEEITDGRQQLVPISSGGVDILTDNDAYADLLLRKKTDLQTGEITLSFRASIRRMGSWMNAREFQFAAGEIQGMSNLLYELEQTTLTVTPETMEQWSGWLADRRQEQCQQFEEPAPGMEMT